MTKNVLTAFWGVALLILALAGTGCTNLQAQSPDHQNSLPKGILYEASQDPGHAAYHWSIHELLLTPDPDMEQILADYATMYQSYLQSFQEKYAHDEVSLGLARDEWVRVVGENGHEGYVSGPDLEWPVVVAGVVLPLEETSEMFSAYSGQARAIPVFALDFSEIVDYFLISISSQTTAGELEDLTD